MTSNLGTKGYELTFEERDDYLYALVEGETDNYEISHFYWQEVIEECKRLGRKKLLVEEAIIGNNSEGDTFQVASELRSMGLVDIKLAFVDRFTEHDEVNKFGEMVAINRGIESRVFDRISEAEEWLRS
ncbi:MAG: hypothetical protein ABI539_00165 [Acidobacteriota bacterium]